MARFAIAIGFGILGAFTGGLGWLGFAGGLSSAMTGFSLGMTAGSIIGGIAFPGHLPTQEGPRLNDLRVQVSTYGVPIPIGYGTVRLAGNVIDSSGLQEHKNVKEVSAKGAPSGKQITYTYTTTAAVALCEGVGNIIKLWADGKLIYDESGASAVTAVKGLMLRCYRGDEDQLPDSALCALHGAANVPAYRGLIYVVLEDFDLTNFGNRLPNFTAEVAFVAAPPTPAVCLNDNVNIDTIIGYASNLGQIFLEEKSSGVSKFSKYNINTHAYDVQDASFPVTQPTFNAARPGSFAVDEDGYIYGPGNGYYTLTKYNPDFTVCQMSSWPPYPYETNYTIVFHDDAGNRRVYTISDDKVAGFYAGRTKLDGDGSAWLSAYGASVPMGHSRLGIVVGSDQVLWALGVAVGSSNTDVAYITRVNLLAGASNITGWYMSSNNYEMDCSTYGQPLGIWRSDTDNSLVFVTCYGYLIKWDCGTQTITSAVDISSYVGNPASDVAMMECAHDGVDENGQMWLQGHDGKSFHVFQVAGLDYIASYDVTTHGATTYNLGRYLPAVGCRTLVTGKHSDGINRWSFIRINKQGTAASLDAIVQDICTRSTVDVGNIDVSQLAGIDVRGYLVGNQTTGRAALDKLTQAFLFGGVESDFKLKFVPSGQSATFAVAEQDLMDVEKGVRFVEDRTQEINLPAQVNITYLDVNNDFQQGNQFEQRFGTTKAADKLSIEIPVVLTATEARQIAQKVLYMLWTQRNSYTLQTAQKYLLADPLDVGTISYKGYTFTVRLVKATLGLGFQIQLAAVTEDSTVFTSTATSSGGLVDHSSTLAYTPGTTLYVLDTPLLQDSDENDTLSGFYFSLTPSGTGTWPGAVLEQSPDGISNTQIGASVVEPTFGFLTASLAAPALDAWTLDTANTITVKMANGTLAAVSDLDFLNGKNFALIGAEGRWEAVNFRDVVDNGGGSYTLRYLMRGRNGTETHCGDHATGDAFILLESDGSTGRITMATSAIGSPRYYQAVTLGNVIASSGNVPYTQGGNDLKPFAPCQIVGSQDGSSYDWTIGWLRRTRYGGAWLDSTGDVPLNEASQSYVVEILSGLGGTVKRTITATVNRATYAAADQVTDFGSHQSTLYVNVYQVSAIVDRGFKATATLKSVAIGTLPPIDTVDLSSGGFVVNGS
ncbi:MAG: phage tail protein [Acidobacteriia bacterium]|nr:phage tail protein [Terriglobia bacterium]